MLRWLRAWRERRRKAKRADRALIRIVAALREDDAERERMLGELTALYIAAHRKAANDA